MMKWLKRLIQNRRVDERDVRRLLPEAALARIQAQVAASESAHTGQIRVCVEAGLPWSYLAKRLTARDRAIMLFSKLRVWDTAANNGVLIYLLLAERAIEIVSDRGLNAHADSHFWQALITRMRPALQSGEFEAGLSLAIAAVDERLRQAYPAAPDQAHSNELPDAPLVL